MIKCKETKMHSRSGEALGGGPSAEKKTTG